jgi:serine/threonine-protein kinase RsbW
VNGQASTVTLSIPASPEYVLLARLTAAGIASRLGLNYDEVDDLRVAVAELCQLLVGEDGREGTVTLVYSVSGESIAIEGTASVPMGVPAPPDDLSLHLIAALADEHEVQLERDEPRVRIVKRIGA